MTDVHMGKLLSVIAGLATVVALGACGGSEEGQVPPDLSGVVPEQVGDYTLQESVDTDPTATGAEEFVESMYQASDGSQVYFALWAFPSREEADQGKQGITEELEEQGYGTTETFFVDDVQGDRLGDGLVLQSSEFETTLWTDNSTLAVVDAPRDGHGPAFHSALYSDREGTSLTSGET